MNMEMGITTISSAMAGATSSGSMSMGGMSMGDGMSSGNDCKTSMLWNWYTIDACFVSSMWHITSPGMFAGSCIGVIVLTMSLSFLRRVHREFDSLLARRKNSVLKKKTSPSGSESEHRILNTRGASYRSAFTSHRPTIASQFIRAFLHMTQFAVAYFVMLLAMYFNGFIIICILIGAFLGYLVFDWEPLGSSSLSEGNSDAAEVTGCCG